jgi:L-alanine-DL-glutamate epimerase-like enolase superfamily enzyme
MDKGRTYADISTLRMHVKTNPRFAVELLAAISKTCRDYGIELSDEVIATLALAGANELAAGLSVPILPGGTNCAQL